MSNATNITNLESLVEGNSDIHSNDVVSPFNNMPNTVAANEPSKVPTDNKAGVIWVTGYSAAGKTTIARKVEAKLRGLGASTIFLDGDDLRSIFGQNWGYDREQRVELARVYFRLCSHLMQQNHTVVIAAVAMYEDVFEWTKTNIPRCFHVYVNVPEEVRLERDRETKKIYGKSTDLSLMYDEPVHPDLVIENFGDATPDSGAGLIVEKFLKLPASTHDMGREKYWNSYYGNAKVPHKPSPFAEAVANQFGLSQKRILEIGCGNGRDSAFFASLGHQVVGIDRSRAAIEKCQIDHAQMEIEFLSGTLAQFDQELPSDFDVVYSRFVLHAMPLQEEMDVLRNTFQRLRPGGEFHIECRSINDPLAREGEVISPTERIDGHYRRFIILDELLERMASAGFEILESIEGKGLAVMGDNDPVVIRVVGRR